MAEDKIGRRKARRAEREIEARSRRRRRNFWAGGALALAVAAVAAITAFIVFGTSGNGPGSTGTPEAGLAIVPQSVVQEFDVPSRSHVRTSVSYPQTPPVGGDHAPIWQNCGYYSTPIANENAVHTLEHGAIWITYRPDLAGDQVAALRDFVKGRSYVLITPFQGLPAPIVASAWGRQLSQDAFDSNQLASFIREFKQSENAPEPGAPCTGGLG